MPEHLFPPEILPGYDLWLSSFWELSTERQIGMGVGPVPASAIEREAERIGVAEAEFDSFRLAVRAMDRVVLDHARKGAGAEGTPKTPKVASRPLTPDLIDALFG